jgi:hypothetical protein
LGDGSLISTYSNVGDVSDRRWRCLSYMKNRHKSDLQIYIPHYYQAMILKDIKFRSSSVNASYVVDRLRMFPGSMGLKV